MSEEKNQAAVEMGRRGARARWAKASAEERSKVARELNAARWAGHEKKTKKKIEKPLDIRSATD